MTTTPMTASELSVAVDVTNPGQFYACCGLLELADRMLGGCRSHFDEDGLFTISPTKADVRATLDSVITRLHDAAPEPLVPDNPMTTPLNLPAPFDLRLDWWNDDHSGGSELKTWAGQQKVVRIVAAMHATLLDEAITKDQLLQRSAVLYEPGSRSKTVEPFYFDSRRAAQAHAIDIGFSPDTQGMEMPVHSATELLCLVGLQRFRPRRNQDRSRSYRTWAKPLPTPVAAAVASCGADIPKTREYQFRLLFRTKYLKGFLPAIPIGDDR